MEIKNNSNDGAASGAASPLDPKWLDQLDVDLSVDMKKLEPYETEVVDDIKKADRLVEDVIAVYDDWQKILHFNSYLTNQFPNLIDALHQINTIASGLKKGVFKKDDDFKNIEYLFEDMVKVYQNRQKFIHSLLAIERWVDNVDRIVKEAFVFVEKHEQKDFERMKAERRKCASFWKRVCPKGCFPNCTKGKEAESSSYELAKPGLSPTTTKHVSLKDESEKIVSNFDKETKDIVAHADDAEQFIEKNKTTIEAFAKDAETMKDDWKPSMKALANVQSIIPLVIKAFDEAKAIGSAVGNAFGAASLNPLAMARLIYDGREIFDDLKAIDEVREKIESVLQAVGVFKQFLSATMGLVSKGRVLVKSFEKSQSGLDESGKKGPKDDSSGEKEPVV